jgi:hypothetical protein
LEPLEGIEANLDPHLQRVVKERQEGRALEGEFAATAPGGEVVVDVLAELADPAQTVPGLDVVRRIGRVVTGTVEVDRIESVREHANVKRLKLAQRVQPQLDSSVAEIRADRTTLGGLAPAGRPAFDGAGVIVGVVDFGCDVAHPNFRRADGSTRLLALWDQNGGPTTISPAGFGYGREFDAARIGAALAAPDPYTALAYNPGLRAHGTHVWISPPATASPPATPAWPRGPTSCSSNSPPTTSAMRRASAAPASCWRRSITSSRRRPPWAVRRS